MDLQVHPAFECVYVLSGTLVDHAVTGFEVPVWDLERALSTAEGRIDLSGLDGASLLAEELTFRKDQVLFTRPGSLHRTLTVDDGCSLLILWLGKQLEVIPPPGLNLPPLPGQRASPTSPRTPVRLNDVPVGVALETLDELQAASPSAANSPSLPDSAQSDRSRWLSNSGSFSHRDQLSDPRRSRRWSGTQVTERFDSAPFPEVKGASSPFDKAFLRPFMRRYAPELYSEDLESDFRHKIKALLRQDSALGPDRVDPAWIAEVCRSGKGDLPAVHLHLLVR